MVFMRYKTLLHGSIIILLGILDMGIGMSAQASTFALTSPAFREGQEIPRDYSGDGRNVSPELRLSGMPGNVQELALLCDDPDASNWAHWVAYSIAPTVNRLPKAIPAEGRVERPVAMIQGRNSWGGLGYRGPEPPPGSGWHRYRFQLFALDAKLKLKPGASRDDLLAAVRGHVITQAVMTGKFRR